MTKMTKIIIISILSGLLSACSGFFDKDNTPKPSPLVNFSPEAKVRSQWKVSTGSGVGKDYLKLVPAVTEDKVFTANKNGIITATNKATGKRLWSMGTGLPISGGPTAANNLVFVGTREGDVIAFNQTDGRIAWKAKASSEILAKPAANHGVVVVKTIDGKLSAFAENDGHVLWHYHQTEPALILRGASAPQIHDETIVAGFANGNLAKLTLQGGNLQWQATIAIPEGGFAIQRMIDIDADPIIHDNRVFAATYQGHIVALDLYSGKDRWTQDLSSYTGMTADNERVYVSDAKSHIWAFDIDGGKVNWRQTQLEARNTTGPAIMGDYIVVGDAEGYLHWLNKEDGHLVARIRVNGSAILATPVVDNNILYVVTTNGYLAAYTIS